MEYKNQTENRAFQEMLQAAVKRLQNRSGEDIAEKSGAVFHSSRNMLEVQSFHEVIEIQLPEFYINSDMDEWHYLTLLHYLDMADGTEGSQKLITFGNLKDGLIRGTRFDRTAEQKMCIRDSYCPFSENVPWLWKMRKIPVRNRRRLSLQKMNSCERTCCVLFHMI